MKKFSKLVFVIAAFAVALSRNLAGAEEKQNAPAKPALTEKELAEADKAWKAVLEAAKPPLPPDEWRGKKPSDEEREAFNTKLGEGAANAADKAREFYIKYPTHPKAEEAQK